MNKYTFSDLDDTPHNVEKKLEIISSVPLVRSLRTLQFWQHPMSLILRSRLHAGSILAGEGPGQPRTPTQSARINAQHLEIKGKILLSVFVVNVITLFSKYPQSSCCTISFLSATEPPDKQAHHF